MFWTRTSLTVLLVRKASVRISSNLVKQWRAKLGWRWAWGAVAEARHWLGLASGDGFGGECVSAGVGRTRRRPGAGAASAGRAAAARR